MTRVKPSTLAGTWYPGEPRELAERVDAWLRTEATPASGERFRAVVVPHAGYRYSGRAAAAAYAGVRDVSYSRVVIIAPSHHGAFRGMALLDVDAFETPLGPIAVDRAAVALLARTPLAAADAAAYDDEHSLEIQLPFLQRALPGACVVPVLVGGLEAADYGVAAAALATVVDDDSLVVVSSDFVHYGRRFGYVPFHVSTPEQVAAALRSLDMGAIERVCAGDRDGFLAYVERTAATICGRVPIALFLTLHRQQSRGVVLSYYTSLDVTGDAQHSVSYASIGFPSRGP